MLQKLLAVDAFPEQFFQPGKEWLIFLVFVVPTGLFVVFFTLSALFAAVLFFQSGFQATDLAFEGMHLFLCVLSFFQAAFQVPDLAAQGFRFAAVLMFTAAVRAAPGAGIALILVAAVMAHFGTVITLAPDKAAGAPAAPPASLHVAAVRGILL